MALPGLSLPGLGLSHSTTQSSSAPAPAAQTTRPEDLPTRTEWRFEVPLNSHYIIRLTRGHAEIFGTELAPNVEYQFSGYKGAVFTWHGCALEVSGEAESEYVGRETEYMDEWMNVHGALEMMRGDAEGAGGGGPRVMVVGPDCVGKTSLVTCLSAWGVKLGRTPTVVNLDPREGLLSVPGSLTAVTLGSMLDVEDGWGTSPLSGPTTLPIKTPLVYQYPFASPHDRPAVFKAVTTRAALAVTSKLEEDAEAKASGIIIDTPGSLNQPKNGYDLISHIVSEFSINVVLTIGSERMYNDLNRRFSAQKNNGDDTITVLRLSQPGGVVERDAAFTKAQRTTQMKHYFFGDKKTPLQPHGQFWDFKDLNIYRAGSSSSTAGSDDALAASWMAQDDDDDDNDAPYAQPKKSNTLFEKATPTAGIVGSMLAIKFCSGESDEDTIRDSAVMGFVYVAEVDETRKKIRFLAPHPARWGDRALVFGGWPEAVADLVN